MYYQETLTDNFCCYGRVACATIYTYNAMYLYLVCAYIILIYSHRGTYSV